MSYVDANAPDNRTLLRSTGVYAFVLVVSLFFLWGVANNLNDILIKQFKKAFELSDFRAGLVQSAFYVGYFLLAIPASLVTRHYGYKAGLLAGLGLYALGAFAFLPGGGAAHVPLVSWRAVRHRLGSRLPRDRGESARDGARARARRGAPSEPGAVLQPPGIDHRHPDRPVLHIFGRRMESEELAGMSSGARTAYYASQSLAVQGPYLVIGAVVLVWALLIATAVAVDRRLS